MKFTIYGADHCPFCTKAVELVNQKGCEYTYVDLKKDSDAKDYVKNELGAKTIPQIFQEEKHIGGYDELKEYLDR